MIALSSIAVAWRTAGASTRKRSWLAAPLLLGWAAFWLATVVAACCSSPIGNAHPAGEIVAIGYQATSQDTARDDHRQLPCPTVEAQPAASLPTIVPANAPPAPLLHISSATPLPEPASAGPIGHGIAPLAPPAPFHQRTSRLLI
jgi:hypothetical protein